MEITINKRGQITIPKKIRDVAGLKPSRKLSLKFKNNKLYIEQKTLKPRIFNDELIKNILDESSSNEKEFNEILSRWRKRKSS